MYLRKYLTHVAGASELLYALAEILDGLFTHCSTYAGEIGSWEGNVDEVGNNSRTRPSECREHIFFLFCFHIFLLHSFSI